MTQRVDFEPRRFKHLYPCDNRGLIPGAACCHPIELATYKAAPLPAWGLPMRRFFCVLLRLFSSRLYPQHFSPVFFVLAIFDAFDLRGG